MQYSLINAIIEVRWSDLDIQRKGYLTKTWISGKLSRNSGSRVVFPPTTGLTQSFVALLKEKPHYCFYLTECC